MWFENNGKVYVSMPGVPYEMKWLMENKVLPAIKQHFKTPFIMHKTLLTQGIGESILAEQIKDWEESLPSFLKLAYLPSVGAVRLRLSGYGENQKDLTKAFDEQFSLLNSQVKKYSYGYDDDTLEKVVGKLLIEQNKWLATAESCTGGKIAAAITKVPGSSKYFKGAIVSYANEIKCNLLNVPDELLNLHGAVSQEVVESMAKGALLKLNADIAVATSGIAGPDGGTLEKPVGLVWIAVATPTQVFSKQFLFGNNRDRNVEVATLSALFMLRKMLLGEI
jgi:nicotinamide-nucleotide amidase